MFQPRPPRHPEVLVAIAANVRRLRERRGWTQAQLAEEMEVEERYVQKIESGKLNFGISTFVVLLDALEVTPSQLLRPAKLPAAKTGRPRAKAKRKP